MTAPPTLPPANSPNVSEEHLRQLAGARLSAKKITRTIFIANFDGWTIGTFGALTLLFGLTDPSSIIMGLGMIAVAWIELRGAAKLRRLDSGAAKTLAMNQLALAIGLILYALWRIYAVSTQPGPYEAYKAADKQMAHMLAPIENLTQLISIAIYGALIVIAMFAQGGLALFYFTRAKHVEAYLTRTPAWIIRLQQSGVALS